MSLSKRIRNGLKMAARVGLGPTLREAAAILINPRFHVSLEEQFVRLLSRETNLFVLQVGANDGVEADPIAKLMQAHPDWKGILVEPIAACFKKLQRVHGADKRFCLENIAIDSKDGEAHIYSVREEARTIFADLYPPQGCSSFNKNHLILCCGPRVEPYIEDTLIPTLTLESLCAKHDVQQIDVLLIDVEGHDYTVLSSLNLKRHQPWIIALEHCHLSDEQLRSTLQLLRGNGYRVSFYGNDLLAIKKRRGT